MLTNIKYIVDAADRDNYAVGAFNVYNIEGILAVVNAAEKLSSPVILQLHPREFQKGKGIIVAACKASAEKATVPVAVHLDHCTSESILKDAIETGGISVMADGSSLSFKENMNFTSSIVNIAAKKGISVEAELGKLSGSEDGLTIVEKEAKMTEPSQAAEFAAKTKVDLLAVCIGNIHGKYTSKPNLDFRRLEAIRKVVSVPLVLHGASGLQVEDIRIAIGLGVRKINVNTEVRSAYLEILGEKLCGNEKCDLADLIETGITAMQEIVEQKISFLGSSGKASL